MEILNTLQFNLNHHQIGIVVVLVESRDTADLLSALDFDNSHKLLLQNQNGPLAMPSVFDFATRCFSERTIIIANQDVTFGSGWDHLDQRYLRGNVGRKTVYALTRHTSQLNAQCAGNTKSGVCGVSYSYSHDAFVFHVTKHIRKSDFRPYHTELYNMRGIENMIIWMLRHRLGYNITNPCSLLRVHHEHCVPIRNKRGHHGKAGNAKVWAGANFTNSFYR